MRSTITTVMAGTALAFFACSPSGFNTPTLLNKVRILAIQADPPQPGLGASTTLRALVYQPPSSADGGADAGVSVTGYSWSWCPLPMSSIDPSQCPIDQDAANQLFAGIPGVPLLDLGQGETATFTNPFPAPMLASLCMSKLDAIPALAAAAARMGSLAASGALSFPCTIAGFPITVKLVAHTSAGDLPAVFTVYLPVVAPDLAAPNANPHVTGIRVDGSLNPLGEASAQTIARNSSVPANITGLTLLDSEDLPDPNEVLPNTDPNNPKYPDSILGPNDAPNERLTVFWFAECGDFGKNGLGGRRTGYLGKNPDDPISPFSAALENTWNIPKLEDYTPTAARIIVVVRDSRGGVNWTSGVAQLGDTGFGADGGASDSQTVDADDAAAVSDAGTRDSQPVDVGELIADAAASDSAGADSTDTLSEAAP